MSRTDFGWALEMMQAEYREMPGLKLTMWQASRLWNLPMDLCRAALDALVIAGFLVETRDGAYRRGSSPVHVATVDGSTWTVTPRRGTAAA